jgi:hypothetical protein
MKSNVTLMSTDRELFGITIRQNTKEQFLSVTDLQKAYEKARWMYGWSERGVNTIMQSIDFKERLYYLLYEKGLVKVGITTFMEMIEKEGSTKVLKGLGVYKTTGRAANKTVMADPYIWVLLAMELNPMLYAKVIIWLTDSLIFDRIEAGSEYLPMNTAIKKIIPSPDYATFAKAINERVFGKHLTGMRNLASAKELKLIGDIEKFVSSCINQGFVKSKEQILSAIENYGK